MQTLPRAGDRVTIPWGLGEVDGEVVTAYGHGAHRHVTIDVLLEGTDEPLRVTFPLEVVDLAQAA